MNGVEFKIETLGKQNRKREDIFWLKNREKLLTQFCSKVTKSAQKPLLMIPN